MDDIKRTPITAGLADRSFAIVCIDDDPFVLQMLSLQFKEIFTQNNFLLELITDPTLALPQIKQLIDEGFEVKLVITDYRMPQMSGYDLVYALKLMRPDIPCVLLSGQADNYEVKDLIKEQMIIRFINKPWKKQDLEDLLQGIGLLK